MNFENRSTESKMLGDILKKLRKDHGYSQAAISEYLDVNRSTYTKYELGRIPDAKIVAKLAKLYGVTADSIVEACLEEEPPELDSIATLSSTDKENAVCILSKEELLLVRYYRDSLRKEAIFDFAQTVYLDDCENPDFEAPEE